MQELLRCGAVIGLAIVCGWARGGEALPLSFSVMPAADTTIFADVLGENFAWDDVSDAQGESLWLSTTAGGVLRRALVRFDLAAIPAGAQVQGVSLTLFNMAVIVGFLRDRVRHPERPRPFRAPFGWTAALLFLSINTWMIVFMAINQPKAVLFSLASIAVAYAAYWPMRRHAPAVAARAG